MTKQVVFFLLIFYFPSAPFLKAQDTLILNDGTEIYVKVLEIGEKAISYKKNENQNGPTYTMDLAKVFMAVYKGGKRESFQTVTNYSPQAEVQNAVISMLGDSSFDLRLIETKSVSDKKQKGITVLATIDVYYNEKQFSKIYLSAYQRTDITLDYTKPNASYLANSSISFLILSENLKKVLFQKYESESGKGYGWALAPGFFSLQPASCSVALLEQKYGNKEILGFGGITATKINLQDCSSLEKKLLSAALLWLETNFGKK